MARTALASPARTLMNYIAQAIDRPLGFFALSLLTAESFLGVLLVAADVSQGTQERGMWAGVGLVALVIFIVTLIVWRKPHSLVLSEKGMIEMEKLYGTYESGTVHSDALPKGARYDVRLYYGSQPSGLTQEETLPPGTSPR